MHDFQHAMFDHDDVRLHYVTAGDISKDKVIVLIHGWPQTSWEWRRVVQPLAEDGWFVVAPDYRGAGASSKPRSGYDKQTMARDIEALLQHIGATTPITLVGHDLGMMVAYAYATLFGDRVLRLVLMDAPIPGTAAYESVATTKFSQAKLWHFHLHGAPGNIAEMLIEGHEREYLRHFYVDYSANPDAISFEDVERYVSDYSAPGAMQAGLELYRAFEQDAIDNLEMIRERGRLKMPVLGLGGTASFFLPMAKEMLDELAEQVEVRPIADSGHWIAEERPEIFLAEIKRFSAA